MNKQSLVKNPIAIKCFKECLSLGYTDKQIQKKLLDSFQYEWSLVSIRRIRRNLQKTKENKKSNEDKENIIEKSPLSTSPPPGLSQDEKAEWFRKDFMKSHLFKMLKQQFDEKEVLAYLEEYGRICCQFEDIVTSEFFQIDDFLKHRILINRQLSLMKTIQKEIEDLNKWISDNPIKENESVEKKQQRSMHVTQLGEKHSLLTNANNRYDKLVAERDKISKNLAATRRDRLDQLAGGKEDFLRLVAVIQYSEEEREKQGKFAELTKISSDDILDNLSKPVEFPDGEIDHVFMDGESYGKNYEES